LRSSAAAHSKGGGVDDSNATMTKSLGKRTAVARFEARVVVAACSGARVEAAVSKATAERGRARGQNFARCDERERGPEILVRGT
jgi:hypothetical protein